MKIPTVNLAMVAAVALVLSGPAQAASSGESSLESKGDEATSRGFPGCCEGAGEGEMEIDILDEEHGLDEDDLIADTFQDFYNVVFPPETDDPAPGFPDAYVRLDGARPVECNGVDQWAISGDPNFPPMGDGDEVFQFLNSDDEPMAVEKVSVSVGFHNGQFLTTMTAYDADGLELEEMENGVPEGFSIMTIDRSGNEYPDIHYVVVSAPMDEQGVGINCITYTIPVPATPETPVESASWSKIKTVFWSTPAERE